MESVLHEFASLFRKMVADRIAELNKEQHPRGLYEPVRWALSAHGKMLRPVLLLTVCEAVGGRAADAVDAAAALEMVHTFSLVHDDIMDNDEMRRGRATVHRKWDVNTAILAGDAILVKAYQAFVGVSPVLLPQALQLFSHAVLQVCEGQALDMEFERRSDVTVEDYFMMIERKTGRLFSAACSLGALLGGGTQDQIRSMHMFGTAVGRAFQIQDDILDFAADQSVLGKDVGSDLRQDKNSFLLLYAKEHGTEAQVSRLRALQNKPRLSAADVEEAISVLKETGAVDAALKEVNFALDRAHESLKCLENEKPRRALEQLVEFIRKRES